jgi:hypothetical protein
MNREDIEKIALFTVSSEYYYDLADNIYDIPTDELLELIACNGDYKKELALENSKQ